MNCLKRNKQKLYYALLTGEEEVYTTTSDGRQVRTGTKRPVYSEPVAFMGNIAFSGGDVERAEFGVDVARYEAILVMNKGEIPITETSLLWYQSDPTETADYKVLKIVPSLNNERYILAKVVK